MRVFISHASQDKPAVIALAEALRAHGIEPWLDKWAIGPGDNFVASINQGLHNADAGIIVFSANTSGRSWIDAEISYLIWARVQEGKPLIPVILGDAPAIPPLLRPLVSRRITEVDAIVDALHHRRAAPITPLGHPIRGRTISVQVSLRRNTGLHVTLHIDGRPHGTATLPDLPPELARAQHSFLQGPRHGQLREFRASDRAAQEAELAVLGRALGGLCFPEESGASLASLIDGCPAGTMIEAVFAADDPVLLGLAFEAARLPDGRVLALQRPVVTLRRPLTPPAAATHPPLAGPLKILLAVAAPDEGTGGGPPLDYERETQNVLDAVRSAQDLGSAQVRILEVGHPVPIADAFRADAYHVLHLSCHGGPGVLGLENEDGNPCPTTAAELLDPIREAGKPLPLVLLNACHGGVPAGRTASMAESLLQGGVPAVLAMQAPVSDVYAIRIADAFYRALAQRENLRPSHALADARKQIERERLAALERGAPAEETQPEYATAALFVAGEEAPLADFHLDKQPLRVDPVHMLRGVVPQLPLGALIGRRREMRGALRILRDPASTWAGVVLTGIGGLGKSALAGRIMCRLAEQGWLVPALGGKFDLTRIAIAIGSELLVAKRAPDLAKELARPDLPDETRLLLLQGVLAQDPVLLVLDDFEQNLDPGGGAFLDPDIADQLRALAAQARTGKLLLTCRFPLPGMDALFRVVAVPPLSPAETRKKLLRLPALEVHGAAAVTIALRVIGGHPRMLEFLDALLHAAPERAGVVAERLTRLASDAGLDVSRPADTLAEAARSALAVGARDIVLDQLLAIVRREGIDAALLQTAVSNLPVTPDGLARMLADDGPGDSRAARLALSRLAALSLLHLGPDGAALVHRWTAEALADLDRAAHSARCVRAAGYRLWRFEHEGRGADDVVEALRNYLAGGAFDEAAGLAQAWLAALAAAGQSVSVAVLASEVLETLPEAHSGFAWIADAEARAHLALGATDRALRRYHSLLMRYKNLVEAEPDRADYQRDLSVSYNNMGDLYRALGQGEAARDAFAKALSIRERLARDEPDRADYQRDLSVSYNNMGDLYCALGQGEAARDAFAKALAIAERLARDEPDRADYQRDLSVSYERMGDLYRALGQGEAARDAFAKDLAIAERLARDEPDRADYQRDLVVSLVRQAQLTDDDAGRTHLRRALEIVEALHSSGRLAPADAPMLPALRQMLEATTVRGTNPPSEGGLRPDAGGHSKPGLRRTIKGWATRWGRFFGRSAPGDEDHAAGSS